jgi:hypothetical protein
MANAADYKVCPSCGAMYDATSTECDLHGRIPIPLRAATQKEADDFERFS